MNVGFKLSLCKQQGWIPESGLLVELSLPTGTGTKSSGDVDPTVAYLWSYALDERTGLAGNIQLRVPTSEKGRRFNSNSRV